MNTNENRYEASDMFGFNTKFRQLLAKRANQMPHLLSEGSEMFLDHFLITGEVDMFIRELHQCASELGIRCITYDYPTGEVMGWLDTNIQDREVRYLPMVV